MPISSRLALFSQASFFIPVHILIFLSPKSSFDTGSQLTFINIPQQPELPLPSRSETQKMAGERQPSINMAGASDNASPRSRWNSAYNRHLEQAVSSVESGSARLRSRRAEMRRALDQLDAQIGSLRRSHEENQSELVQIGHHVYQLTAIQDRQRGKCSLSDVNLNDLPDGACCDICMDPFGSSEDPERPVRLRCGHVMGSTCISQWAKTNDTCPLCRRNIFEKRALNASELHIMELVEEFRPSFSTAVRNFLESPRVGSLAWLRERLESAGLSFEEGEHLEAELNGIRTNQTSIEEQLFVLETLTLPMSSRSALILTDFFQEIEKVCARWDHINVVYRRLIEDQDIQLPRLGRLS